MAIPWLIGAVAAGAAAAVAAALSDKKSDKSSMLSTEIEQAIERSVKARVAAEKLEKEKEQQLIQKIGRLEQSIELLMSSYGLTESEALKFLNPDEDINYLPDYLIQKHDKVKHDFDMVKKALKYIEDIENEL